MATTKRHTSGLVDELCVLPSQDSAMFGVEPQQIRDLLGKAIERYAVADDHARRMVDWLLFERLPENRKFRPTPGEIREASEAVPREKPGAPMVADCELCGGSGGIVKGLLNWRERMPDGSVRERERVVESEDYARELAAVMPPDTQARGLSCAVDCACRKATVTV